MLQVVGAEAERSAFFTGEGARPEYVGSWIGSELDVQRLESLETIVVSKRRAGLDAAQLHAIRSLLRDAASGLIGACKFLIFDLACDDEDAGRPPQGFDECIDELSNLIFEAPVISVAWVRGRLAGPDLELALACSMVVGETDARFSFDVDLVSNPGIYSLMAHKIGFVQTERLLEGGAVLQAAKVHDLMLLNAVVEPAAGLDGIRQFVKARARRHNSACGIYRAQRIAMLGA